MEKNILEKEDKKIHILVILDITTSMGNKIKGFRQMIKKYFNPINAKIHIINILKINSKVCYLCNLSSID